MTTRIEITPHTDGMSVSVDGAAPVVVPPDAPLPVETWQGATLVFVPAPAQPAAPGQ